MTADEQEILSAYASNGTVYLRVPYDQDGDLASCLNTLPLDVAERLWSELGWAIEEAGK